MKQKVLQYQKNMQGLLLEAKWRSIHSRNQLAVGLKTKKSWHFVLLFKGQNSMKKYKQNIININKSWVSRSLEEIWDLWGQTTYLNTKWHYNLTGLFRKIKIRIWMAFLRISFFSVLISSVVHRKLCFILLETNR